LARSADSALQIQTSLCQYAVHQVQSVGANPSYSLGNCLITVRGLLMAT